MDGADGGSTGWEAGGASRVGRRADRPLGGAGGREAAGACEEAASDWARGRRRGQHRSGRCDAQGHRGDEHARRERRRCCRADAWDDAGDGASSVPRRCSHARRQVGEEISAGNRTARKDARDHRSGPHRDGSGAAGARLWNGVGGARSVCLGVGCEGTGDPTGGAG